MSASIRPTRWPCMCSARARLAATVDLPTPPLPLATATTHLTPGSVIFWPACPGGCMVLSSLSRGLLRGTFRTLAQGAEVLQRVQPGVVAVVPHDLVGVAADRGEL